jgi:glycosyltransferase involved in cell wall biosynthesis
MKLHHPQQEKTILHFIDTTGPGGAETVFLDLVEQLQIENYRNIALIKGPGWVEQQLKKRNIEYYIKKPSGFFSIPYYLEIIRFCKEKRVALIQAHLLGAILTSSIVGLVCRIPLIATIHGQVDINSRERFVFLKHWLMAAAVNKLIAVSSNLADYLQKRGLFKSSKIEIIYNGVDTTRYYRSNSGTLRKKLDISNDAIIIGSLGNVRPAKNYNLLIEAAAIIQQMQKREFHFLIAGHQRSDLMNPLNQLMEERDVTKIVHFLGFLDDTPEFLSELDLFLLCSSSEGFSIATIEAMAAEVPVISTRCGGPEEIITDNVTGILIDTDNPKMIAETIVALVEDKKRKEALVIAAAKHVKATFSTNSMLNRYKFLYKQVIEKHKKQVL